VRALFFVSSWLSLCITNPHLLGISHVQPITGIAAAAERAPQSATRPQLLP